MTAGAILAAITALGAATAGAADAAVENTIVLDVQVDGIGAAGAKLEIRPGHPGCQFTPITRTIAADAVAAGTGLKPIRMTAKSSSADRDCSFLITITEPGLPAKTIRRGLILRPKVDGEPTPKQLVKWTLNSPSMATKDRGTVRR